MTAPIIANKLALCPGLMAHDEQYRLSMLGNSSTTTAVERHATTSSCDYTAIFPDWMFKTLPKTGEPYLDTYGAFEAL